MREDVLDNFGEEEKKQLLAGLDGDSQYHIVEDTQAWERGGISKKFAYQPLQQHESDRRLSDMAFEMK
ncbi:MAG: hypothetical protein QNJ82_07720 [Gammaproteobacteria bacterium]|nr:hypothetical protein [Gammaproteobacteria bacterium]